MLFDRAQPIIIIRDGSNNIENEKSKIIDQIARESGIPRDNIKVRIVALPSFSTLLDPIPLLTRHIFAEAVLLLLVVVVIVLVVVLLLPLFLFEDMVSIHKLF